MYTLTRNPLIIKRFLESKYVLELSKGQPHKTVIKAKHVSTYERLFQVQIFC